MNKKVMQGVLLVVLLIVAAVCVKMFVPFGNFNNSETRQVKPVSRDHLRITSLYPSTKPLASIDQNPFSNPLLQKAEPQKENKTPPKEQNPDIIPVTPVMQRDSERPKEPEQQKSMKLKALASTGDRKVAVIEYNGKTTSAFIGSAVGTFIVTDIDGSRVSLQSINGQTITLELVS